MKWSLLICLAALYPAPPAPIAGDRGAVPAYIAAAVADPARPAPQVALDALRKPTELIAFSGLKPGDRVADFMPGNAYFTRIFSRLVGPRGRVYAFLPAQELAHCEPEETAGTKALARDTRYANVRVLSDAADRFTVPEPLDLVWTAQNYHDLHDRFMAPLDITRLNAAIFRALKPGGAFIVIDHVAAAGVGLRDTETLHRIDPDSIVAEVTAAGFVLEAQSALLRNPEDTHALPVFDAAIRHHTDQVVLRFRKPLTRAHASHANQDSAAGRQPEPLHVGKWQDVERAS
jgi:predicted methyltransferase